MKNESDIFNKKFESLETFPLTNIKIPENYYHSFSEETSSNPNYITKKTNRGRKRKIEIPENIPKCEVCLELSIYSKESLISCSNCKCLFHKSCYNQYEEIKKMNNDIPSYICIRCSHASQFNQPIDVFKCFICNHSNRVLKYNNANKIYYHKICLDFIGELNEEELSKDIIRRWRFKNSCKYCGDKLSNSTSVVKCKNSKCKQYYHIPCAIKTGLIFDLNFMKNFYKVSNNNKIPFYCYNHNKKISKDYITYIFDAINCDIIKNNELKTFQNEHNSEEEILNIKKYTEEKEKIYEILKTNNNKLIDENEEYYYKNEEDDNNDKNSYEERKEMSIDENEENINSDIFNSNLDNIEINNSDFNKNKYFETKNINCEMCFDTKFHHFYKNGGLIFKKSSSFCYD